MSHTSSQTPGSTATGAFDPTAAWPDYCATTRPGQWLPDILGDGFSYTSLPMGTDEEGELCATLVRYDPLELPLAPPRGPSWFRRIADQLMPLREDLGRHRDERKARQKVTNGFVLSLHGWSDYFYNTELAEYWHSRGYSFYAIDLRRYGRSLRAHHQNPGFTAKLEEYDADLASALATIRGLEGHDLPGICVAHSTGGLIASLWVNRNPDAFGALILNSPWLEMQGSYLVRYATQGVLEPIARVRPRAKLHLPEFDHYWRSLSRLAHGSWDLHPLWRPQVAFAPTAGWITAILAGHKEVSRGLHVKIPILVLTSRSTHLGTSFDESMLHNDSVIEVQVVRERSLGLGSEVTNVIIDGSMHDVFTSLTGPRAAAYEGIDRWAAGYLPTRPHAG